MAGWSPAKACGSRAKPAAVGLRISDQIKPNKKLDDAPRGGLILRVWFLDAQHGYAVGLQKSVFETHDGGRTWKPLDEAAKPASNPAFSVYSHIAFADARRGMIVGAYVPPRRARQESGDDLPDWMLRNARSPAPAAPADHRNGHPRRRRDLEVRHSAAARFAE